VPIKPARPLCLFSLDSLCAGWSKFSRSHLEILILKCKRAISGNCWWPRCHGLMNIWCLIHLNRVKKYLRRTTDSNNSVIGYANAYDTSICLVDRPKCGNYAVWWLLLASRLNISGLRILDCYKECSQVASRLFVRPNWSIRWSLVTTTNPLIKTNVTLRKTWRRHATDNSSSEIATPVAITCSEIVYHLFVRLKQVPLIPISQTRDTGLHWPIAASIAMR